MRWRTKARVQNLVSLLPESASYSMYYWLQRRFGGLRQVNPNQRLRAGIETWKIIKEAGRDPNGGVFLEIGTGRMPLIPIGYWLMGASSIVTVDLNPYMKAALTAEALNNICQNQSKIKEMFGSLLCDDRFEELLRLCAKPSFSLSKLLELCNITYVAPGNAAATGLDHESVDFHTSRTVLEHIPPSVLRQILDEGNRIVRQDGLFVHRVDYSDHFSHSDKSISAINFLQYSENEWKKLAGNRYMYMNRLRHDDFLKIFESAGHSFVLIRTDIDKGVSKLLRAQGIQLDNRFKDKSIEDLSVSSSWLVTEKTN